MAFTTEWEMAWGKVAIGRISIGMAKPVTFRVEMKWKIAWHNPFIGDWGLTPFPSLRTQYTRVQLWDILCEMRWETKRRLQTHTLLSPSHSHTIWNGMPVKVSYWINIKSDEIESSLAGRNNKPEPATLNTWGHKFSIIWKPIITWEANMGGRQKVIWFAKGPTAKRISVAMDNCFPLKWLICLHALGVLALEKVVTCILNKQAKMLSV